MIAARSSGLPSRLKVTADRTTENTATLHMTNAGTRVLKVHPLYTLEKRDEGSAPFRGELFQFKGILKPSEGHAATIPLPILGDQPWRVGVWCEELRPAWKVYACELLIKVGLRERQKTAVIEYSNWFNTNSDMFSDYVH